MKSLTILLPLYTEVVKQLNLFNSILEIIKLDK